MTCKILYLIISKTLQMPPVKQEVGMYQVYMPLYKGSTLRFMINGSQLVILGAFFILIHIFLEVC